MRVRMLAGVAATVGWLVALPAPVSAEDWHWRRGVHAGVGTVL